MSDSIGPVPIPDPPHIPPFPLQGDYGGGMDFDPPIAVHTFNQTGLKTEQRFVLGSGVRRFRVQRDHLSCDEYDALKAHWIQASGTYGVFSFTYRRGASAGFTLNVRYDNPVLTFDQLVGLITGNVGIVLVEVPSITPNYTSLKTLERIPAETDPDWDAFATALRQQVQHIIPVIAIKDRANATPAVYLSNQRFYLDGVLYLPRLTEWGGISQTLGDSSDDATFTFGDADQVFTNFGNQINLFRATVQFGLYHVESRYLLNLWRGYALRWRAANQGQWELSASDGLFELGLGYPVRSVSRTCWKVYKGRFCPSTSSLPTCPKSWEACNERGVPKSFGGAVVPTQGTGVFNNDTGVVGWGRSGLTSVTIVSDSVYQRPLSEVYTDIAMNVPCDVAMGRDENDFYAAIGIVGEGPIGGYNTDLLKQRMDEQPPHDPQHGGGWRGIRGTDPAAASDFFGIDQAPWVGVPFGTSYAAGIAFAEIRRNDESGLQLSKLADRKMSVSVTAGIGGWVWTAPGARTWQAGLSNPIWVAVNVYLRGIGLRVDEAQAATVTPAVMESYFDVNQAVAMAAICDLPVAKLVGDGTERQFPFRGALRERKPLKDWIQEICNCCLGYYTFKSGKLWLGIRENSSVLAGNAYTRDTILFRSLQSVPLEPRFNQLTAQFGDEEFDWELNNVTVYDIDHAGFIGTPESPQFTSSNMSLVGVSNKSQAARIVTTRLREELGGVGPDEQRRARNLSFETTVLALRTMVGDVISVDDDSLPDPHHAEARVTKWTLRSDFTIQIEAGASTDSMYDLTYGPKPDDVPADPPKPELLPVIKGLTWMPNEVGPAAGDPLVTDPLSRTFAVWQDYTITREGSWDAALWVRGEMCINRFQNGLQPRIAGARVIAGGTLNGPMTLYIAVTQRSAAAAAPLPPSNLIAVWIPPGTTGRAVHLDLVPSDTADMTWQWDLFAGTDRRTVCWQKSGTNLPLTMDFLGPVHAQTQATPEGGARKVAIAAKQVWHSGIAGVLVNKVTAPNKIQSDDFIGSTDNWVDRFVSALADQSDGSAPLWNFKVTAFDSATGTLTVSPDCVVAGHPEDSVEAGDVLIVRSVAVSADATSVSDPMWNNSVGRSQFDSPGLRPSEETGRIVRVLYGKGAGQFRWIKDNTATSITVRAPWDTIPDATSIIIVEAADWVYSTESSELEVQAVDYRVELRLRVENLRDHVALVGGFLVDEQDRYSDEDVAPLREIYVFGQPPTVRVIGPTALDPDGNPWIALATDHTLRVDCSTSTITVHLMPLYVYQGRPLLIVNEPNSTYDCTVAAADGETLFDGQTETVIPPGMTMRFTAG